MTNESIADVIDDDLTVQFQTPIILNVIVSKFE